MHSTHELEDGAMVTFKEVVGMAELNGTTHKVKGTDMCLCVELLFDYNNFQW